MTKQEAIEFMRTHPEQCLDRDASGKGYICPICGSGSGPHGTGMTTKDGIHFVCWKKGCFSGEKHQGADIIEIIAKKTGARNFPEAVEAAAKEKDREIINKGLREIAKK